MLDPTLLLDWPDNATSKTINCYPSLVFKINIKYYINHGISNLYCFRIRNVRLNEHFRLFWSKYKNKTSFIVVFLVFCASFFYKFDVWLVLSIHIMIYHTVPRQRDHFTSLVPLWSSHDIAKCMPSIPRSDIFTAIRTKIAAYMKMYLFITLIYMTINSIKSPDLYILCRTKY
jgi:hypothetical protein